MHGNVQAIAADIRLEQHVILDTQAPGNQVADRLQSTQDMRLQMRAAEIRPQGREDALILEVNLVAGPTVPTGCGHTLDRLSEERFRRPDHFLQSLLSGTTGHFTPLIINRQLSSF